jgi:hypothetical protein
MNLAKINPAVQKTFQISPFETTTEQADYMSVSANQYIIGGDKVSFGVRFGTYNSEAEHRVDKFKNLLRHEVVLTKDEIADWGTDDTIIFEKIAEKLGTSIVEIIEDDIHQTY